MLSRRRLIWWALGCAVAAVIILLVAGVGMISSFSLISVPVHGTTQLDVDHPGEWVIASESRALIQGRDVLGPSLDLAQLRVQNPAGESIILRAPERTITYAEPDRAGEIIAVCTMPNRGSYTLTIDGVQQALIGFGPDPMPAMIWWTMLPGAMAIVLLGIAAGLGWVGCRRSGQPPSPA